jgi:predicted TPR repeat methyltransferase
MGIAGRPPLLARLAERRLTWFPEPGVGFYPVECGTAPYDRQYFDRYARQAQTPIGRALMRARCDLVEKHHRGILVDVGIGSGAFIDARRARRRPTVGYDISPPALEWLEERGLLTDPYLVSYDAISLWDVLEHMPDFSSLLEQVREWLFLSLPIFTGPEHALASKHFRPAEHCWYFTRAGLIAVMAMHGFELVEETDVETRLGREDIGTFVFRRIAENG